MPITNMPSHALALMLGILSCSQSHAVAVDSSPPSGKATIQLKIQAPYSKGLGRILGSRDLHLSLYDGQKVLSGEVCRRANVLDKFVTISPSKKYVLNMKKALVKKITLKDKDINSEVVEIDASKLYTINLGLSAGNSFTYYTIVLKPRPGDQYVFGFEDKEGARGFRVDDFLFMVKQDGKLRSIEKEDNILFNFEEDCEAIMENANDTK